MAGGNDIDAVLSTDTILTIYQRQDDCEAATKRVANVQP